jgi:hypothetical protein
MVFLITTSSGAGGGWGVVENSAYSGCSETYYGVDRGSLHVVEHHCDYFAEDNTYKSREYSIHIYTE